MRQRRRRNPTLPDDVVTEILQRLPAKSLLRFKYVCKLWYDLIRSPNFISTHYNFHKENKPSLLCLSHDDQRNQPVISFHLSENLVDLNIGEFPHDLPEIAGCSYGLVCISLFSVYHNKFVLWNPATGDYRIIDMNDKCFYGSLVSSGFYFDVAENSHKVVRITNLLKDSPRRGNARINVFTLRENSWKQKDLVIPYEIPRARGYISEVTRTERYMYWKLEESHEAKYILCFDMVDMVFSRIEFPCLGDRPYYSTLLAEYRGSLAMFALDEPYDYPIQYSYGVWVLNSGDKKESWTKQMTLRPLFVGVRSLEGFFVKGGADLVFVCAESGCFLWNSVSGEMTEVLCHNFQQFCCYSERLASVF